LIAHLIQHAEAIPKARDLPLHPIGRAFDEQFLERLLGTWLDGEGVARLVVDHGGDMHLPHAQAAQARPLADGFGDGLIERLGVADVVRPLNSLGSDAGKQPRFAVVGIRIPGV
jgi:hypothetical protein